MNEIFCRWHYFKTSVCAFVCTQLNALQSNTNNSFHHYSFVFARLMCRVPTEVQGKRAKLCCRLISDFIIRVFYFTPLWQVGVMPCPRKSQKELYKRKQQQIGDEDVSFIFSFISWVQQPFHWWGSFPWIQLKCLNPQVKVSKIR